MKVHLAIRELLRSEKQLADKLVHVSDRHKVDHEVFYMGRDLARWSHEHVRELVRAGRAYGIDLEADRENGSRLVSAIRQKGAELIGRRGEVGLLLLADLRELYRAAAGVSLDWELLAQAAQALKDRELLALCKRCHPETLRQARWANTRLKEASPQILVS